MKFIWTALVVLAYAPSIILLGLVAGGWAPESESFIHWIGAYIPALAIAFAGALIQRISSGRGMRISLVAAWPIYILLVAAAYVSTYVNKY